jgi:hypothetical protein
MTENRKEWSAPELFVHGSVENITRGWPPPCEDKDFGASDGVKFQGTPIGCVYPS